MRQSTCTLCGAPIYWFRSGRDRVALDAHETMAGQGRVAIRGEKLVAVSAKANVLAYTPHDETCPKKAR